MEKSNKNILLIHLSLKDYSFGKDWEENPSLSPPLGLLYLGAPLLKDGYNVTYTDLNVDKYKRDKFLELLKQQDLVLISCYTDSMKNVPLLIEDIRNINEKAIILCGGPYCMMSEHYIEGSDYTCIGEVENHISDIIDRIINKKSLDHIPGIFYKKEGKIVHNEGLMKVDDLNISMPPALSLARGHKYGSISGLRISIASLVSSRGCPFDCSYCTHKGRIKYRERDVDNVIEELKSIQKQGYKFILFSDDNFLLNKNRAKELMDEIIRNKIKMKMLIQGRVDSADDELYYKLRIAGVIMILFGIENPNQDVLTYYNKKSTPEKIKNAVDTANKFGILSFGYYIVGSEIETEVHFENVRKHFDETKLDFMIMGVLFYIMGAKLWDDALKTGKISPDEECFMADKRFSKFSSEELIAIKDDLIKYFYMNPKRILRAMTKTLKLGLVTFVLKAIFAGGIMSFLNFIKNPYDLSQKAKS